MQSEEVTHIHFSENTVQFGWLVVQVTQRCHCHTYTHRTQGKSKSSELPAFSTAVHSCIYSPYIENPWNGMTPVEQRHSGSK